MEIPFLDLKQIDESLKKALLSKFEKLLDEGVYSFGAEVAAFEEKVKRFLGSSFAISCANGTDALELALRALEIGPGDEVIVPAMTWVSTAEAVSMVGAKPVFWDTDEWGHLKNDWIQSISSKTKAVIPVHLFGQLMPMQDLMNQARSAGIYVIEDAAQAFGSTRDGKAAGTFGDVGCLSFYPTKNLGALGEAGMCLTQEEFIAEKIKLLANHGQPIRDEHILIGRNSRIDTIQAGFLNVILDEFDRLQKKRKHLAGKYLSGLKNLPELKLPEGLLDAHHNAHLFVIQTPKRDELKKFLASKGIGTAIHYPEIIPDLQPYSLTGDFPNAKKLALEGLSLPLNPWLREIEAEWVINAIQEFFKSA